MQTFFQILNFDVWKKWTKLPELGSGGGFRWSGQCPKENVFFSLRPSLTATFCGGNIFTKYSDNFLTVNGDFLRESPQMVKEKWYSRWMPEISQLLSLFLVTMLSPNIVRRRGGFLIEHFGDSLPNFYLQLSWNDIGKFKNPKIGIRKKSNLQGSHQSSKWETRTRWSSGFRLTRRCVSRNVPHR